MLVNYRLVSASHLPTANCNRVIVSQNVPDPGLNLTGFWNIAPGYSMTYLGERLDNPEDDSGNPVSGAFITRLDYEAPVRLCGDTDVIPQRWTKNNRWGYWLPAAAKPEDRNGSFWTEGNANYRFFVTHPVYDYPWVENMMSAYAQKVYRIEDSQYVLGRLGQAFDRTILNSSRQEEYFYYPPYLLSLASVPLSGLDPFARIDSSYRYDGLEMPEIVCQPKLHTEDHYWYTRVQLLTDLELLDGFTTIESYLGGPKEIAVLTFFEAIGLNNGRTTFREDWYLMQDVGVVGIDQAFWDVDDSTSTTVYLNTAFMKEGTAAPPHVQLRADRAFLEYTLQVTAVSPNDTFPLIVNPGECYTFAIHSLTSTPMPYDGYLEHNFYDDPSLWRSTVDGQPQWAENGLVTSCLPDTFPAGETRVLLRPYTMTSPNEHETQLFFSEKPWSINELWVIVP